MKRFFTNPKLYSTPEESEDIINKKYFDEHSTLPIVVDAVLDDGDILHYSPSDSESIGISLSSIDENIRNGLTEGKIDGATMTVGSKILVNIKHPSSLTFKVYTVPFIITVDEISDSGLCCITGSFNTKGTTIDVINDKTLILVKNGNTFGQTTWMVDTENGSKTLVQLTDKVNVDSVNDSINDINSKLTTLQASLDGKLKDPVKACSDENIDLTKTYATANDVIFEETDENLNAYQHQAIEGYRYLLIGQTDKKENGIYEVKIVDGARKLVRSEDADTSEEYISGFIVVVREGKYADKIMTFSTDPTDDNFTLDTDDIEFKEIGKQTDLSSVNNAINDLTTSVNKLTKKSEGTFTTDGSATSFEVTHEFGTDPINVYITDADGNDCIFEVDTTVSNKVTISSNSALATGQTFNVLIRPR